MKKIIFLISVLCISNLIKASEFTPSQMRTILYVGCLWHAKTKEEADQVYSFFHREAFVHGEPKNVLANYGNIYRTRCRFITENLK